MKCCRDVQFMLIFRATYLDCKTEVRFLFVSNRRLLQYSLHIAHNNYFSVTQSRGETDKGGHRAKGAINDILIMTCCMKY